MGHYLSWQQSSLAVGTYTASGNSNLAVGMPCAFYSQQTEPMNLLAQSTLARDREYDDNPDDDFSSPNLGEEIELTLFLLARGPYYMPYPFFKEMGYTSLVTSTARQQEKQDFHARDKDNKDLRDLNDALSDEVRKLRDRLIEIEAAARSTDELARTDSKLFEQALVTRDLENKLALEESESQSYNDMAIVNERRFNDLQSEALKGGCKWIALVMSFKSLLR
nr:hypothetical protein [Tanacetum cinerariifolium]